MNYKSTWKMVLGAGIACLVVVLPAIAGCAPTAAPPAEKVTINFIDMLDLTGPYSATHQLYVGVAKDFFNWVDKTNPIPGAKIVHTTWDHGMSAERAVAVWKQAMAMNPKPVISTGGLSSLTGLALKPLAERDQVPIIDGISTRGVITPPGWVFSIQPSYESIVGAVIKYGAEHWKGTGKMKFSVMGWDNPFGRSQTPAELVAYAKSLPQVEYVAPEYFPLPPSDVTLQLSRYKDAGVNMVYLACYAPDTAIVLKDAQRLGIKDKINWYLYSFNVPQELLGYVAPEFAEGIRIPMFLGPSETWEPVVLDYWKASGLPDKAMLSYALGWCYYSSHLEATKLAAQEVGVSKVTGNDVYKAITTKFTQAKNFKPMGALTPVTWSTTKCWGPPTTDFYEIKGGKVVPIDKAFYVPDLTPGGKDVPK